MKLKIKYGRFEQAELKAALQKYIRRAEIEKAVSTARQYAFLSAPNLARRLPIICAEDCGWRKLVVLPEVVAIAKATRVRESAGQLLEHAVAYLAQGEKDQDGVGLSELAIEQGPIEFSPQALTDALDARDELAAVRMGLSAMAQKSPALWSTLRIYGPAQRLERWAAVVDACEWRAMQRGGDDRVFLLACLVMAGCGDDDWAPDAAAIPEIPSGELRLDWYGLDQHTMIGQAARGIVLREDKSGLGLARQSFDATQWAVESAKVNAHRPQKYFDEWARDLAKHGLTIEEARDIWEKIRGDVREATESVMSRRGKL